MDKVYCKVCKKLLPIREHIAYGERCEDCFVFPLATERPSDVRMKHPSLYGTPISRDVAGLLKPLLARRADAPRSNNPLPRLPPKHG